MVTCCTKIQAQTLLMGTSPADRAFFQPTQFIPLQIKPSASFVSLVSLNGVELTQMSPSIRAEFLPSSKSIIQPNISSKAPSCLSLYPFSGLDLVKKHESWIFHWNFLSEPIAETPYIPQFSPSSSEPIAETPYIPQFALSSEDVDSILLAYQSKINNNASMPEFDTVNGRIDLVQEWNKKQLAGHPALESSALASPTVSEDYLQQKKTLPPEHINGRVDLIAQWLQAQESSNGDSSSFSSTLESLLEDSFFLDLENIVFGDRVQLPFATPVAPASKSPPTLSPSSQLPLPIAPAVPRPNPVQPGGIVSGDNRPLDTGSNAQELLNLVEESQNASPPQTPSYVPVVPLEKPQLPDSPPKESSVSPLPPNVPKEVGWQILDIIIENLITDAASKYPFLVNTSDLLTINPNEFNPQKANTYVNTRLDLDDFSDVSDTSTEAFSDPVLSNFTVSGYPNGQQFYWILPGNRVVIETEGGHFNIGYQGRDFSRSFSQRATSRFGLFGVQAVFALPQALSDIVGTEKGDGLQILSGVAEITLPRGLELNPFSEVQFNLININGQGSNTTKIVRVDDINKATTNDREGGGASFVNLDASNAPRFLQAFPTINLQPFLTEGLQWRRGEEVSVEDFARIGITVGDPLSGQGFRFDRPLSSNPGLKTLQLNTTDNNDLVRLLSNPFLSDRQRDLYYLNSLMWYSGGQGAATIENIELNNTGKDWYRTTVSWSKNRTLLTYHPENIELNYTNIFTNPGLSLTYTDLENTDNKQILNASAGLLFGGIFSFINPGELNSSLDEAHTNYEQVKSLDTLKTKATSQQRRAMNFRLNRTLQNASSNSALSQLSGSYTFYGKTTPNDSLVMQIRSGLYSRAVSFYEQTVSDWTNSPWRISSVRPSDFGPLVFTGVNVPIENTNIDYNPIYTLGFVTAIDQGGEVVFDQTIVLDRYVLTAIPILAGRAADIDFGRINFIRTSERQIETQAYQGYLYLPALEFLLAGTIGDWNYNVSLGSWYNFYPQSAPSIDQNQPPPKSSITTENNLGFFFKSLIKADINHIFYDENNQWETILTHTPALTFNASTEPNRLNISSIGLSYTLQLLRREYGGSLSFSTSYSPQELNAFFENNSLGKLGLFTGLSFYHQAGFRLYGSLSLGDTSFYYLESTYDILRSSQWGTLGIGPYISNYVTATRGFNSQIQDNNYGGIITYSLPNSNMSLRTRLGMGETGFRGELSLNGQIKF